MALLALFVAPMATAQTLTDSFNGPALASGLQMSQAGAFTLSGGATETATDSDGNGIRQYISTTLTDFRSHDFTLLVSYTISAGAGDGNVFVGLGSGQPDVDGFYGEPLAAVYVRNAPSDFASGEIHATVNNGSGSVDEHSSFGFPGSGTNRVEIVKVGNTLTFAVDAGSSGGAFVPDYSTSFDLAGSSFSFLNDSDSRLFIGSGGTRVTFNSLSITSSAIPEPATFAALAGCAMLGMAWRRRRLSAAR